MPQEHDEVMNAIAEGDPLLKQALENMGYEVVKTGKITVEDMKELIPDEEVKARFLGRPDLAHLSLAEREVKWQLHLPEMNKFLEWLSNIADTNIIATLQTTEPPASPQSPGDS